MNEFPVWLLTVLSHSRSLFVALLKACEYLLTCYIFIFDYTVDKVLSAFGVYPDDGFMDWAVYCLEKEAADYTDMFDNAIPYVATLVKFFQSAGLLFITWFLSFLLPFSHLASPSLTNEFLLLCCILFTLFVVYGRLGGLVKDATAAVDPIGQDIRRQAGRQLEVGFYHEDSSTEYVTAAGSFEGLLATAEAAGEASYEADDVLYEEALGSAASQSLQLVAYEEAAMDLLDISCEELEDNEAVIEALVDELEVDSGSVL